MDPIARQSSLELLVWAQPGDIDRRVVTHRAVGAVAAGTGRRASHQAAVIPPVEGEPRPVLPRLVLQVGGLIEFFVVVNAKRSYRSGDRSCASDLRGEETGGNAGEDHQG